VAIRSKAVVEGLPTPGSKAMGRRTGRGRFTTGTCGAESSRRPYCFTNAAPALTRPHESFPPTPASHSPIVDRTDVAGCFRDERGSDGLSCIERNARGAARLAFRSCADHPGVCLLLSASRDSRGSCPFTVLNQAAGGEIGRSARALGASKASQY